MNTDGQTSFRPLALTPRDCKDKRWHPPGDLSFASARALVPIHAGELAKAAASMPLAVIREGQQWQLVGVCGLHDGHNLYVLNGQWQGIHQPAWLDTWPLSIYAVGDKGFAVLDQNSGVLSTDDSGEPLFTADGQPAPALAERLAPLSQQHRMQSLTSKALDALAQADLLTPWPEAVSQEAGISIEGLHMIDEQALVQLPDDAFLKLRSALPLAYAVNFSIQQLHMLHRLARLQASIGVAQPQAAEFSFMDEGDTLRFG